MTTLDRRNFLRRSAVAAGGLTVARPLQAFAANRSAGERTTTRGYGPLRETGDGDLRLPEGFRYRIVSRQGEEMSDGNPTPGICDGMAAFAAPGGATILMRNHENRRPFFPGSENEIPVVVPERFQYDRSGVFIGGVTKLVVSRDRRVERDFAVLGGTTTNCAGGMTPWGSWITCEEFDFPGPDAVLPNGVEPLEGTDLTDTETHGFIFEVDATTNGPVKAVPIKAAGRFYHEAVAWRGGRLYQTEDFDILNPDEAVAFYRYTPNRMPRKVGDLAASGGVLQALKIAGRPNADLRTGVRVGRAMPVEWVTVEDPNPPTSPTSGTRNQAFAKGAARFTREEGAWVGNGRVYFDCTDGGDAGFGQIFELDPDRSTLTLIYESPAEDELDFPDNLTVAPTGDLFLCENGTPPDFIRGLTPKGQIFDFAQAVTNETEFAGACFSADGETLFVNQNGGRGDSEPPGVTYAIWGPFASRSGLDDERDGDGSAPRPDGDRPRSSEPDGGGGDERSGRSGATSATRSRGGEGASGGGGGGGGEAPGEASGPSPAPASAARNDDDLPFTGFPLATSLGAAGVLLGVGAILRRRIDQAAESGDDAPGPVPPV